VKGGFKHMDMKKNKFSIFRDIRRLSKTKNNDAILLVFKGDNLTEEKISTLDLSTISEIKRDKDGGVTVKFSDKQSILENLIRFTSEETEKEKSENFLTSMVKSSADDG
jgi:hypothetical protein